MDKENNLANARIDRKRNKDLLDLIHETVAKLNSLGDRLETYALDNTSGPEAKGSDEQPQGAES